METQTLNAAKQVVLSFLDEVNNENFKAARKYVTDDLIFIGVMGARDGADAYFKDMENMRLKYKIKKAFEDGNDVCVLYDIDMAGKSIFTCGWYKLRNGKIASIHVIFDPRPIL